MPKRRPDPQPPARCGLPRPRPADCVFCIWRDSCPRTHKPTEKIIPDHKQKEKTYEKH